LEQQQGTEVGTIRWNNSWKKKLFHSTGGNNRWERHIKTPGANNKLKHRVEKTG